jgi:hypothetical protein
MMNWSAKGEARSSPHYRDEGDLIHSPHQGVCGRHGTEEQGVTSGGLAGSPGGTGVSRPISASEMANEALVSSRTTAKYRKRGESHVTEQAAAEMGRGRQSAKRVGKGRGNQMSKGVEVDQFHE